MELQTFIDCVFLAIGGPRDRLPAGVAVALKAAHEVDAVGRAVAWVSPRGAFIHI